MNGCEAVQDELSAYLDGELPAEERVAMEAHLKGCATCRETLAELGALKGALNEMPHEKAPVTLAEKVRRDVLAEREKQKLAASLMIMHASAMTTKRKRSAPWAPALLGLAALLMLCFAAFYILPQMARDVALKTAAPNAADSPVLRVEESEKLAKEPAKGAPAGPDKADGAWKSSIDKLNDASKEKTADEAAGRLLNLAPESSGGAPKSRTQEAAEERAKAAPLPQSGEKDKESISLKDAKPTVTDRAAALSAPQPAAAPKPGAPAQLQYDGKQEKGQLAEAKDSLRERDFRKQTAESEMRRSVEKKAAPDLPTADADGRDAVAKLQQQEQLPKAPTGTIGIQRELAAKAGAVVQSKVEEQSQVGGFAPAQKRSESLERQRVVATKDAAPANPEPLPPADETNKGQAGANPPKPIAPPAAVVPPVAAAARPTAPSSTRGGRPAEAPGDAIVAEKNTDKNGAGAAFGGVDGQNQKGRAIDAPSKAAKPEGPGTVTFHTRNPDELIGELKSLAQTHNAQWNEVALQSKVGREKQNATSRTFSIVVSVNDRDSLLNELNARQVALLDDKPTPGARPDVAAGEGGGAGAGAGGGNRRMLLKKADDPGIADRETNAKAEQNNAARLEANDAKNKVAAETITPAANSLAEKQNETAHKTPANTVVIQIIIEAEK